MWYNLCAAVGGIAVIAAIVLGINVFKKKKKQLMPHFLAAVALFVGAAVISGPAPEDDIGLAQTPPPIVSQESDRSLPSASEPASPAESEAASLPVAESTPTLAPPLAPTPTPTPAITPTPAPTPTLPPTPTPAPTPTLSPTPTPAPTPTLPPTPTPTPTPTPEPTSEPTPTATQTPDRGPTANQPSAAPSAGSGSGNNFDTYDNPSQQQTTADYVLNTNTMKFHIPSCSSVAKIAPQNYSTYSGSRSGVIGMGYDPCGRCKP